MKVRIYYEDTDAAGIVYHANFIKYCERARSEIFFRQGFSSHDKENNEHFVIRNIICDFLQTAFLGDLLDIKTEILKRKNSSIILKHDILRDKELICSLEVVLVYVKNYKAITIPDRIFKILENK
ncbi:MAG: YbgC/FadM family acyl-CoA thioesterase [Arcobacter sp.]|jgi:acyl-CoA thioester hydrolase|uniref:YbgC/FadM family acyl-CoA thioesterase n=2 Tax=Arcobacter TaxID=28196 RepID=UPI0002295BCB|nr:YbgC/FadM family acyl-CoA thioesterase [Arcobacter sp. L]BAK71989.1 putative thioesterase [Arcobacter sp. L]